MERTGPALGGVEGSGPRRLRVVKVGERENGGHVKRQTKVRCP